MWAGKAMGVRGLVLCILVLLLATCGNPPTLEQSLLGHWVTASGRTHYYFDVDTLVMIDDGTRKPMSWTLLEVNDLDRTMVIRVIRPTGSHEKSLEFSEDGKSIIETTEFLGVRVSTIWNRVDSKRAP